MYRLHMLICLVVYICWFHLYSTTSFVIVCTTVIGLFKVVSRYRKVKERQMEQQFFLTGVDCYAAWKFSKHLWMERNIYCLTDFVNSDSTSTNSSYLVFVILVSFYFILFIILGKLLIYFCLLLCSVNTLLTACNPEGLQYLLCVF